MLPALPAAAAVVVAVLLLMLVELQLSVFNERALRRAGAVEPSGDVYPVMRVAYPAAFVLMGIEALRHDGLRSDLLLLGVLLFGLAKALKFWAIAQLGRLWSFRVLVLPGQPLVATGPYRHVRHPNYIAVLGEIVSVALALQAPVAGAIACAGFAWLLRRRIVVEERALGLRPPHAAGGHGGAS
ncbi:MAG TPA: isoprenylcysteine carboxylmethyltransferase family protein [Vicinamibacterales bacterium]